MRITQIIETTVPLEGTFSNAVVSFSEHTVSLVGLVSDQIKNGRPVIGFAFNSIGRFAQAGILRDRMMPRLLSAGPETLQCEDGRHLSPAAIARTALRDEKPGGHGDRAGAVAALELAAWDLNAKLNDEPAYATIRREFRRGPAEQSAAVYAAGGYYYPEESLARSRDEISAYQDMGYRAFKIKVGGAPLKDDLRRVEAAVDVAGDASALAVDANARFDLDEALEYARALEPMGLRWFEEPGDPLDYALNKSVTESYSGAVATGENLFGTREALNLAEYGGMRTGKDVFQMDPGLSYGLTAYVETLEMLESRGYGAQQCFPHGGHLINLHIVVGLGLGGCEAYPGVFRPLGGFAPECQLSDGRISPSDAPGFGLEQKPELAPYLTALQDA